MNPISGRAIGQGKMLGQGKMMYQKIVSGFLGIEILYSFVIIVCSLMVYYSTKELYELTNHKGIKYFRKAFLFFAIAYFFRTFIKFFLAYFDVKGILDMPTQIVGPLTLLGFIYFSTMALFYLLYSLMYKKWNSQISLSILHIVAIIVAIISVSTKNISVILIINLAILLFVLVIGKKAHTENKKSKNNLYTVYALLFIFWILNVVDILVPQFLQTFQLLIYLASTGVFLTILYKVLKKVGS